MTAFECFSHFTHSKSKFLKIGKIEGRRSDTQQDYFFGRIKTISDWFQLVLENVLNIIGLIEEKRYVENDTVFFLVIFRVFIER